MAGMIAQLLFGASDPDTRPYAYLNYLIFDEQFNSIDGGAMRVPQTAGFDPGFELLPHQEVKFQPVAINTTGYMYVWVSNESEATKVWFDDLSIVHHQSIVTQATDYGVWGEVLREQKTNVLDLYRYGYQGQFAEKDEETGWNHFELREYDPVIGRWISTDPAKQYFSPFVGMGNNSIINADPDGAYSKWGAAIRAFFTKGASDIYRAGDQWGFNAPDGTAFDVNGQTVNGYTSYFGDGSGLDFDITAGLQAGIGIGGFASVDVTVVNFELLSSDPEKYYDGFTEIQNSIGVEVKPAGISLVGVGIGQKQNAKRVKSRTTVKDYHKFVKGSLAGVKKEWSSPDQPSDKFVTKSIFSLRAILGIDIVWKEKID